MADHSLKPATDHRLGEPLPHQLANQTQAHQKASRSPFQRNSSYKGLPIVSKGYTSPFGRFLRVTHPSATHMCVQAPTYPYDLHVLSILPAFILSQDQTLKKDSSPELNPSFADDSTMTRISSRTKFGNLSFII